MLMMLLLLILLLLLVLLDVVLVFFIQFMVTPDSQILLLKDFKLNPLRDEEDARFCGLVYLVRRSSNTLQKVRRLHDMDNHMLAIIELHNDDRIVWS